MTKGFICLVFVTILSYMIMNVTEIIRGKDSLEFLIQCRKYDSIIELKYKQMQRYNEYHKTEISKNHY